jgi:hypothetical protein
MTRIECSSAKAFVELLLRLREDGVKLHGYADDTGMFYLDIIDSNDDEL